MTFHPKYPRSSMHFYMLLAGVFWVMLSAPFTAVAQNPDDAQVEPFFNSVWTTPVTNPNPNNFDTAKIMQQLRNPSSNLVMLSSHRGVHAVPDQPGQAQLVPENSLESIGLAAQQGWEMIELDVKLTSDGLPILSHDLPWGRQWCGLSSVLGGGNNTWYNPFIPPGQNAENDSVNPAVKDTSLANLRSFAGHTTLRDVVSLFGASQNGCSIGNQFAGEYPPTLANALDYITKNGIHMVVLLDIKDTASATAAWNVVQRKTDADGRPFSQSTIFKISMTSLQTPAAFLNTFGQTWQNVNFLQVINTSAIAPPASGAITNPEDYGSYDVGDVGTLGFGGEEGVFQAFQNFVNFGGIQVVAVEVNYKQSAGILTELLSDLNKSGRNWTIGIFNPTAEYYDPNDSSHTPQFIWGKDATCCATLARTFYNNTDGTGPNDPNESAMDTDDRRGNLDFLSENGFSYWITDDPVAARVHLVALGKRNICEMQASVTADCETGGAAPPSLAGCQDGTGACSQPVGTPCVGGGDTGACSQPVGLPCVGGGGNGACQNPDLPTTLPGPQSSDQYNFLASSSATFTVNAGATTFTATQPNDSVATYIWTDGGGAPLEWLTSANGSSLGAKLEFVPVSNYAGVSPSATITVNAGTTFQTIDGFGGAMTDSAASLILNSANNSSIMDTLFGTDASGGGLTIVRSPMGSSDLMADPTDLHTYEDTPGNFSVTAFPSDNRQIAALQQAKRLAGANFKLLGTPWTAPGWMKRGGSLLPAQCGTQQNEFNVAFVQQYAQYFTNYVNAYSSLGLTPWMVSMQNEPENCQTSMPTTLFSPSDEVAFGRAIKGQLPNGVKVLGWDHNWNDENYVNTLTSNNSVDAVGYHCYDGTNYKDQTQAVPTYFTECTGFISGNDNVATNLGWEVANNIMGPLRYGSRGSIYWSLAQDLQGNPHYGGAAACNSCRGMITVNSDGGFLPSQDYYFWAQFSKFVAPGAVRIDSNNSGNLSTVAFHQGNTTTLVVLNSSTHADGGTAGPNGQDLRGHIVQWNDDTKPQKTAWLVGSDGHRRWISDGGVFNCLKFDAGMQGPDEETSGSLDRYINLQDVWAVCGAITMGTDSELEVGTYLKSPGGARLTLTSGGIRTVDAAGVTRWAPGGTGDRFILQEDGNLVLYSGTNAVWASGTAGSGAIWLSIRDDGTFALFNKQNQEVWVSILDPNWYRGKIVEWDGDTKPQKTSWFVGSDGNRRFIPDLPTFQCLHDAGAGNSYNVTSDILNFLPDLTGVQATCSTQ